jgi:AmmeMemoRadiSam system protein B
MVKRADFAGSWYPASEKECRRMIDGFERDLDEAHAGKKAARTVSGAPLAVMAPHAGWLYSGSTAWAALRAAAAVKPTRIVIFGGHLGPHDRHRLMDTDGWETPFGVQPADRDAIGAIANETDFEIETERRYRRDNGVELVLALAAAIWPETPVVAIGAPASEKSIELGRAVRGAIERRGGLSASTLFIASTDLTHYGPDYGFTPKGTGEAALRWSRDENDAEFLSRVVSADAAGVLGSAALHSNACCPGAVAAAITASGATRGVLLRSTTSHERVGGVPENFVGYGAVVLTR